MILLWMLFASLLSEVELSSDGKILSLARRWILRQTFKTGRQFLFDGYQHAFRASPNTYRWHGWCLGW